MAELEQLSLFVGRSLQVRQFQQRAIDVAVGRSVAGEGREMSARVPAPPAGEGALGEAGV